MTSCRPPISSETDSGTDTPSFCSFAVRSLYVNGLGFAEIRRAAPAASRPPGGSPGPGKENTGGFPPAFSRLSCRLLAQTEFSDELAVALEVLVLQVHEQAP